MQPTSSSNPFHGEKVYLMPKTPISIFCQPQEQKFIQKLSRDPDAIQKWLDRGGDPNLRVSSMPLLGIALRDLPEPVARCLIDHGAALTFEKGVHLGQPLMMAIAGGKSLDLIQLMVGKGASLKEEVGPLTPLHMAVLRDRWEICRFLLDEGVDVNLRVKDGPTPLDCAVRTENAHIIGQLLVRWGDFGNS